MYEWIAPLLAGLVLVAGLFNYKQALYFELEEAVVA